MKPHFDLHEYGDILDQPRPASPRKKMSMTDRGAQFSPFAALTGYEDAVEETARLTDRETVLTEESKALLDEKLRIIASYPEDLPEIAITHFVPDERKAGGAYRVTVGIIREISQTDACIVMMDRQKIPLEHVRDIRGSLFSDLDEIL